MRARILYATDILPTEDIASRVARSRQSAAAARLLDRLGGPDFRACVQSRSHSRAVVAVAAGNAAGLSLGIDIEWMAPGRPFGAIAGTFLTSPPQDMGIPEFYRGWTFFEAHYKAFQRFPGEALVRHFLAHPADGAILCLGGGIGAMQCRVADFFQLCIVWHHATSDVDVEAASIRY